MADKLPDRYYVHVSAKAKIGGKNYPLQSFNVVYALDDVPKATLEIVLGRGMSGADKGKVSSGHGMLASIKPFTPVEISINLKADGGRFTSSKDDSGLRDGQDQLIFTGFLFTPEQTKDRMGGSASLTFRAIGYPAALGGSTQFVTGLTNIYPDSHGVGRIIANIGSKDASLSGIDTLIQTSQSKPVVNEFILELFQRILEMTNAFTRTSLNTSADAALQRMRNNPLKTPDLLLDYGDIKQEYSDRALAAYYTREVFEPWRNPKTGGDLWSALRGLAAKTLFHIVPAINHDALAPVTFGLGGKEWRSFEPSDYWTIQMTPDQFTQEFYSYVGKVGVMIPDASYSTFQKEYQLGRVVGYAELNDNFKLPLGGLVAGKLITVPPPLFMICPGPPVSDCGPGGEPLPDAAKPDTSYAQTNYGNDLNVWVRLSMGEGYASAVLRDKMFEHRGCMVVGRFRLDIAPGSLVKIRTIGERFVSESEVLYGHAYAVSLRGEPGKMETAVSVIAVRTETEHNKYTVPSHPLYNARWAGAMLTD